MSCMCHFTDMMNKPTKDDIYAYALAKTLTKVSSPATVGLYSACQDRNSRILGQLEANMTEEASRIEREYKGRSKPRSAKPSLCNLLSLIGRLLFYRTTGTEDSRNVRFIYVHFSAWHFAGSDLLWAGLVIRLFEAIQLSFGKLQFALYRVAQYDEEEEVMEQEVEDTPDHWRSKKVCCCPLWFCVLCILVIPLVVLVFVLTLGPPKINGETEEVEGAAEDQVGVIEGLAIAALGVPAVSGLRFVYEMVKNLIFSQKLNIKRGMDNEQISSQLGFMNEVRKEMWLLSRFIQFMEVFERRRIRVVLKITHLDRCDPKKIVSVLDAINILLSDEESPFISILAVNPEVLVQKVNFADGCFSKEDRAYALLNSIVTLAFTVPPLGENSKHILFHSLTKNYKLPEGKKEGKDRTAISRKTSSGENLVELALDMIESKSLIDKTPATLDVKDEEVETLVQSILVSDGKLDKYMLDNTLSMRRVINSIRVTVIIMKALQKELPHPENVAAWVVLANQWPCRLSWILQCVEDAQQRADIDRTSTTQGDGSETLWKVFRESKAELYVMSTQIEELLEQDGDPEMFEKFLSVDFVFTVKDLETFDVVTVNLDHSIRNEMAQIRGTSRLKDSGWMRNLAPLPIPTIINMSTDDVCKELERMEYPSQYADIVRSHKLDGVALIFGNRDDLKELLAMTFGEWATFRLHFLGAASNRQTNVDVSSSRFHSQSNLVRHHIHTQQPH